ncbi:MAG: ATP-dependent helicase [Pseudomonadota bacterium]
MIDIEAWRPADDLILEPNAYRAVIEPDRCLALTAGPGAGKTETLAQRADFLLRTGMCRYPKRILAISFKVDASRNLKERVRRRCGADYSARFDSYTFHAFAKRIIDRFRPVLVGEDALEPDYKIGSSKILRTQIEFKDLLPLAVKILESCVVARNAIRLTYSDVFLDEFQDCTGDQYELLKLIFEGTAVRLTAVGDTKQKIMGWAGALDGIFQTFATDFNAIPLNMYRNFRSQPRLLRMQNEIIRVLDPTSVMPDEQLIGDEGEIHVMNFETSQQEAINISDLISKWITTEGISPSEVAVLISKQPDLYTENLMLELANKKIPFRNEQDMQDLSLEPVARLIVDYLTVIFGAREPKAWIRLMNSLTPFADEDIQADFLQIWQNFVKVERGKALLTELIDNSFAKRWECVKTMLEKIGLNTITSLSPDYESKTRLKEVIRDTRNHLEKLTDAHKDVATALAKFSDDQSVRILTIHKCKGLEFHSVIIMAVENQIFFGNRDENRCAFFVGVSRAKKRLMLTTCNQRSLPSAAVRRWDTERTPVTEFIAYATPFVM